MTIAHCTAMVPLLAGTLGVAAAGLFPGAAACAAPPQELQREIVVTGRFQSDAALAAKVAAALQQNAYIFSDHVSVTSEKGVVRVGGVVRDLSDLFAILTLARHMAGKGQVVNDIEYVPIDDDGN